MSEDLVAPPVPAVGKAEELLGRFLARDVFGIPMAVVACGVGAIVVGCVLALATAGR